MEDERIWKLERSLWTGDGEHYREMIDEESLFVVPAPPFILQGSAAAEAMAKTPRWDDVRLSERQVVRPQEGLIVIAYHVEASAADKPPYVAHCTTTLRRLDHDEWRVVQHQQMPPLALSEG